jgi:molybdopterin-guanine dinucleotide biosynthesis protein A
MRQGTLTAVLLAGGQSRRMGMDKATLRIAGEPLWSRQLRLLRELHPESLLVSARTPPAWCPPDIPVALDAEPSRGPLSGVAAALAPMRTSHLLVLAVDLPRMTTEYLRQILERARPGCGVVPVRAGRFEPLCAVYPAEAAPIADAALKGDDASLQTFVRRLLAEGKIQEMPVPPGQSGLFQNWNAPPDVRIEPSARA